MSDDVTTTLQRAADFVLQHDGNAEFAAALVDLSTDVRDAANAYALLLELTEDTARRTTPEEDLPTILSAIRAFYTVSLLAHADNATSQRLTPPDPPDRPEMTLDEWSELFDRRAKQNRQFREQFGKADPLPGDLPREDS